MKGFLKYFLLSLAALSFPFAGFHQPVMAGSVEIRIADTKGDWGYPNPFLHYPRGPGYIRMSWVFDTLVWKDRGGYVPALAEKWSYDAEKTAFTFQLHPDARWHDGTPLTARDVAFTVDYFKRHPYPWITLDHISRAEVTADRTVRIHLREPYAPFLPDIGGTMPILPEHVWEKVDQPRSYTEPDAFIGSGPFVFRDFNGAQGTYLYEAFEDYYRGRPKARRLIYIKSAKALVSLLSGQADLASIQPEMASRLEARGMVILRDEAGWTKKLMINHRRAPLDDRALRQALAFAMDRREIIEKAHRSFGRPASFGLLSADHEMYNPGTPGYPCDVARARKLIESLGYTMGPDGFYHRDRHPLRMELLSSSLTAAGQNVADRDGEIIKRQLERAGIRVDLLNLEQATADSRVRNWNFDLAVSGHGGIAGDPRILGEMISSKYGGASVNSARYDSNEELNRLLDMQMTEMDEAGRRQIVYRIQEIHAEDLPAIPLYYPLNMAAYNPEKGIEWFYTGGGISKGIPIPQNKMSLLGPRARD